MSPADAIAAMREMVQPGFYERDRSAWDALTKQQQAFVIRGLGMDPNTTTWETMTRRQHDAVIRLMEGLATTCAVAVGILEEQRARNAQGVGVAA